MNPLKFIESTRPPASPPTRETSACRELDVYLPVIEIALAAIPDEFRSMTAAQTREHFDAPGAPPMPEALKQWLDLKVHLGLP